MFGGDPLSDESNQATLIIGVGYQPLSIIEIVRESRSDSIRAKLFLPFPSIPPGFTKNWRFVDIKKEWSTLGKNEPLAMRLSEYRWATHHSYFTAYRADQPRARSVNGACTVRSKTHVACDVLIRNRERREGIATEIGYTQPRVYHPDYSSGMRRGTGSSR